VPGSAPASAKTAVGNFRQRMRRYTTLLVAELLLILIYPFFSGPSARDNLPRALSVVVFCAALFAVLGRGRKSWIAFLLGVPAILLRLIDLAEHLPVLQLAEQVLGLVFLVFVTGLLVWSIVSNPTVTADTLAGAVSGYLLIGITFGMAYMLIGHLRPGSFRNTLEPGKLMTPSEFSFFSFVTLTTVGYGDIVPWDAHARALAIIESVIGIMYPAVLIGRLVGVHASKRGES